ncbi:SpoIID/LytB domain-containing protein [Silvibacterium acidisoli]|uniref:SpoIID/LytB domain-containing protein n=1 Tax=Acidobacteriaceae bacterium ZG23-2 TaxID=2883246 RepID=UPI00406C0DDD
MRWRGALLLCTALACFAQEDGGGRDVSVALLSAHPPQRIIISAAGPGAWWSSCATCQRQPLTTPLQMPGKRELVAGGPITIHDAEHSQERTANGRWHFRAGSDGAVQITLTLPSERYVAAVLMGETAPGEPRESLRAMAVVARTFALHSTSAQGPPDDICDSTACQAIRLGPVSDAVNEAVRSTAGETLWFETHRAQVFFSGSCGGTTESAGAVWPKLANVPYLRSTLDPYCVRKDRAAWHAEIPLATLQQIAAREGWRVPAHIASLQVTQRTSSQRARTLLLVGHDARSATVSASSLRLAIGRSLGWNLVRSDAYDIRVRDGVLVFDGHGHGHGVGLCQQGAAEMARTGKSYREILSFYFPGTNVRVLRLDDGWKEKSQDAISFRSTSALPQSSTMEAVRAWAMAKSSFAPRQDVSPMVIFAPSTEIFRQMTGQPGWQLASTSGSTIILQPSEVLAANHASLGATLRHEMLHVAVEASANSRSPLWLREGLVEVLAGDAARGEPLLSAVETERLLRSSDSRQASEAAHRAAAARTRQLVEHYGMSVVRGWLVSGSPVPAD